jgi:hypothetical protein
MKHGSILPLSLVVFAFAVQCLTACGSDGTTDSTSSLSGGSSSSSGNNACSIPTWDVTYEIKGNFMITGTTLALGDATNAIGPGTLTLRFPDSGGAPAAGGVVLLDYGMPIKFSKDTSGLLVDTDIVASAGPNGCGVASGKLADNTLLWNPCMYNATNGDNANSWTPDDAASGTGCIADYKSVGTVTCTDNSALASCSQGNLMDGENKQDEMWNQPINTFVFAADLKSFSMGGEGGPAIENQIAPPQPAVETPNRSPSFTWFNLTGVETARKKSCGCSS